MHNNILQFPQDRCVQIGSVITTELINGLQKRPTYFVVDAVLNYETYQSDAPGRLASQRWIVRDTHGTIHLVQTSYRDAEVHELSGESLNAYLAHWKIISDRQQNETDTTQAFAYVG